MECVCVLCVCVCVGGGGGGGGGGAGREGGDDISKKSALFSKIFKKSIYSLHAGYIFHAFVAVCCLFSKLTFSKSFFRNTIRVVEQFWSKSGLTFGRPWSEYKLLTTTKVASRECFRQSKNSTDTVASNQGLPCHKYPIFGIPSQMFFLMRQRKG